MQSSRTSLLNVALAAMLTALVCGCEGKNNFVAPPPPTVKAAQPVTKPVVTYYENTGTTSAVESVDLMARVSGYLKKIDFKDGEFVEKNRLLFQIDDAPYAAAVASAKAAVAKADAQLRLAEQQLGRTKELAKQNAATKDAVDVAQAERDSAAADVASAKASLDQANLDLSYTKITAPFAGRIGRHRVDVGNLVQAGTTVMAHIETVSPMRAYFNVNESDLLLIQERIRKGTLQYDEQNPPKIELALGESGDFAFEGYLDFREFGVDPQTGTTQRRAVFANEDGRLIPGLFVRIRAQLGDPKPGILIDPTAVQMNQQGIYVLLVDENNVVSTRMVKLGHLQNGLQVIESGLTDRDWVIIGGTQKARPDSVVNVVEVNMETGAKMRERPAPKPAPAGDDQRGLPTSQPEAETQAGTEGKLQEENEAKSPPVADAAPPEAGRESTPE